MGIESLSFAPSERFSKSIRDSSCPNLWCIRGIGRGLRQWIGYCHLQYTVGPSVTSNLSFIFLLCGLNVKFSNSNKLFHTHGFESILLNDVSMTLQRHSAKSKQSPVMAHRGCLRTTIFCLQPPPIATQNSRFYGKILPISAKNGYKVY